MLSVNSTLQGRVYGNFIEMNFFLTGKPRPLGREVSIHLQLPAMRDFCITPTPVSGIFALLK